MYTHRHNERTQWHTLVQTKDTHLDLHGRHRYEKQQCVKYVSDTIFWTCFFCIFIVVESANTIHMWQFKQYIDRTKKTGKFKTKKKQKNLIRLFDTEELGTEKFYRTLNVNKKFIDTNMIRFVTLTMQQMM